MTLAGVLGHRVGQEGTFPTRCASPAAEAPGTEGAGGRAEPSQCHQGMAHTSRRGAGSSGSWGAAAGGGRGRGPAHSPQKLCYIYPHSGPGLGFSCVTQALQPARIRGDGTFLSKNNPPTAGERAGVEVTDWTAACCSPARSQRPKGDQQHSLRVSPAPRWHETEPGDPKRLCPHAQPYLGPHSSCTRLR